MKLVINTRQTRFSISRKAAEFMARRGNKRAAAELAKSQARWYGFGHVAGENGGYERNDPDLIAAVEALGSEANGSSAELKIVHIPNDVEWQVEEYDGLEWVSEKHRTWE